MQFSESWLRSLCNPSLSSEELCHVLTMAGLEVEERRPAGADFSNVVVAHVMSVDKHPDADKLKLCSVDVGEAGPLQIVCGAPNVAAGMKVPCARVGAKLPGIEIKQAKVRGIESFGMLCSARELGLSDDHGGLLPLAADAKVGEDIRRHLDLDDHLITLKLTPNRADCLSLLGIARELSALTGAPLLAPEVKPVAAVVADTREIVLDAPQSCSRYCGRIIRNVNAKAPTPEWIKRRIERSGIRSISFLVDVTNYVMLELGQPLHAFDDAELSGAIHVRLPRAGEQLLLLNEQTVTPSADTALIADDAKPLAMAGIMGGEHSGINDGTRDLFLESAFFPPAAIAGKARALGFSSDASHRYERGVDFELQRKAIERATQLILDTCGGQPGPVIEAVSAAHLPSRKPVRLRTARVSKVLGIALDAERIEGMLKGLGLAVERQGDDFLVTPPSFRFDIEIEEDLIEEIARIHGYDNIPSQPPVARMAMMPATETSRTPMTLRRMVAERNYHEVVTFSFVEAAWEADFAANKAPIVLANPIASQMGVMRSSLIGGLVGTLVANRKRQSERVRVFELGRCFRKDPAAGPVDGFAQPLRLAGLAAGPAVPEQWGAPASRVDFYDVKADVEALFAPRRLQFAKAEYPALHPGRCATVSLDGQTVGIIGELHPRWVQKYELGTAPVVFELELAALLATPFPEYVEVSRFPAVIRDLALVVPQSLILEPLLAALRAAAPAIVRDVALFDVYQGKGLAENEKSLAFRIVMQDTQRTLEDAEVEAVIANLLAVATRDFSASLRG
ncbi:phenylalanine--tRNA ligase subunit beta [Sulfuritalea hydrogenivorans]|uniref:Phenylalanine--tRNA ligase beta subunit n=1 Tax=Sulfuritalea hydrogenivorans sk43H TaxID=1223802 RepID=W0SHD1_9PROT|nr:phenylalanine--tRNA ligase subunit beta [Sulfuritalea hydrogenivorans]MDK9712908.1 phenylalanine--tRNA ligase subunit beta [Sulfuritalea sp.]BAO30220.1 phenylalanyl-tRNA ligase subunit beta [Sulfuritalea hydrogenivorans sk43H]